VNIKTDIDAAIALLDDGRKCKKSHININWRKYQKLELLWLKEHKKKKKKKQEKKNKNGLLLHLLQ